jgi:hypothetical protein
VPLAGVITLLITDEGAMPVSVTACTAGVITVPPTTTLGAEPNNNAVPVGVITSPPTTSGTSPTNVSWAVAGSAKKANIKAGA